MAPWRPGSTSCDALARATRAHRPARRSGAPGTTTSTSCESRASPRCSRASRTTWSPRPSSSPTRCRGMGPRACRGLADRRPPGRVRRLAPRRGRADGPRLRPLRRAAGRPAGPVGHAAVRAGRRGRPRLRARRGGRQGPGSPPPVGGRAWLETRGRLPVNVGSSSRARRSRAPSTSTRGWRPTATGSGADLAVISDTGFFEGNQPAITIGLRGLVYSQIDVTGPTLDLHSGTWGGNVQNPANALATIIAGLKRRWSVAVPGFYDEVRPLTPRERDEFARLPFDERAIRAASACRRCSASPTSSPSSAGRAADARRQRHLGRLPGRGAKTIIPAHAHAKVSCRLVADMDPHAHVRAAARRPSWPSAARGPRWR